MLTIIRKYVSQKVLWTDAAVALVIAFVLAPQVAESALENKVSMKGLIHLNLLVATAVAATVYMMVSAVSHNYRNSPETESMRLRWSHGQVISLFVQTRVFAMTWFLVSCVAVILHTNHLELIVQAMTFSFPLMVARFLRTLVVSRRVRAAIKEGWANENSAPPVNTR